jgi:sigma-E factor negative regulatory protein RseB
MRQTLVSLKFVVALSSFVAPSALAQSHRAVEDSREAQNWLHRMQTAAQKVNFSGIFVYQQANQVRTSRITHLIDGKDEIEKLEILDGKPREYVRHNDEIICYLPDARTLLIEKKVVQDIFPAILSSGAAEMDSYYDVKRGYSERVAGYEAQGVLLEPKDNLRYGYRLWAEKSTGLLLRAQTVNDKGEVVEQIMFTQLEIGNIGRGRVKASFQNTSGWRVENGLLTQMPVTGWSVKNIPAGFKKVHEMKRLVVDGANAGTTAASPATVASGSQRELIQLVYSDGLAAFSIFIEPSSRSRTEGSMQQGAMNITGKRQGEFWLTIVGEVPAAAIRQVANSIEFKTK